MLNIWKPTVFVNLHEIITLADISKHFGVKYSHGVEAKRPTLALTEKTKLES